MGRGNKERFRKDGNGLRTQGTDCKSRARTIMRRRLNKQQRQAESKLIRRERNPVPDPPVRKDDLWYDDLRNLLEYQRAIEEAEYQRQLDEELAWYEREFERYDEPLEYDSMYDY